jgi:hypothetical protein
MINLDRPCAPVGETHTGSAKAGAHHDLIQVGKLTTQNKGGRRFGGTEKLSFLLNSVRFFVVCVCMSFFFRYLRQGQGKARDFDREMGCTCPGLEGGSQKHRET